ncbi:MAG: DUF1127 domain-containing protein [Rhizobiaceae bacterium]|nr:DUF1127 domain-containing protein [Rhizobiaceae bacterium]
MGAIDTISDQVSSPARKDSARRVVNAVAEIARTMGAFVADMIEKRRSRLVLLSLTDEQLKDIGLSRADAEREGLRKPWE